MGIAEYRRAVQAMADYPEMCHFHGPKNEEIIWLAEDAVGWRFPPSYREFLLQYGAGSFRSSEFYGVVKENFEQSGVPDAIWCTLRLRREARLPENLLVVHNNGAGEMYCIDLKASQGQEEGPVVVFGAGLPDHLQTLPIIAPDFGSLMLEFVTHQVERMRRAPVTPGPMKRVPVGKRPQRN